MTFVKRDPSAPAGFFAAEAAGLRWLASAMPDGGTAVATVIAVDEVSITLPRLQPVATTPSAAARFGRGLARMHRTGAAWHGCPPDGWTGPGFIGSLPMGYRESPGHPVADRWGPFFAGCRIAPFARAARDRGALDRAGADLLDRVCSRLQDGDPALIGPQPTPARLHGDLWSGNVLWTAHGAMLIDPAAHGGHRESDLAMLALFGLPHLDRVVAGYHEEWPLDDGWRERRPLHQLFPLLVHAVLFGGGYGAEAVSAARSL